MRIFKRGKVYWYEFVWQGQRIQKSTRVKNRRDAEEIASAYRTALAKEDVGILRRQKAPKFDVAMRDFLAWSVEEHRSHPNTTERYRYSSMPLLRFFGDTPLDRITPDDVEQFKTVRAAERVTVRGKNERKSTDRRLRPATVNRELACLRAMYNYVAKGHPDLRNPVSRVKFLAEDNQQDRVLTFAEQRAYLNAASSVLRAVAGLILETGMRPEEVFTLQLSQLQLDRSFLKITQGKTPAARRRIELTPEAVRILQAHADAAKALQTRLLFPCETDSKRPLPGIQSAHARALKDSGVAPFRPYDLRHTWATRAAEAGIDLVTLASMLGHSKLSMVMRYAHPTQGHRASAMERLAAHNAERRKIEESAANVAALGPRLVLKAL